jgi:beta-lactamase superfamily II metal-dependent hydrolase
MRGWAIVIVVVAVVGAIIGGLLGAGVFREGKEDTTPPVISQVTASSITAFSCVITWTTDEPATSQVEYGTATDYSSTTIVDGNLITNHSVSLSGLTDNTTYHYCVKSKDAANNEAASSDYTFTTSSSGVSGQLTVHFIDVGQGDAILIDYGTYEMLIDGGRYDACAAYISSYVDGALEVMVATHPDADHIGGLNDVLDAFVVEEIWHNGDTATTQTYTDFMDKVNAEGAQVHEAQRGDQISLSALTFDVLHPTLPLGSDRNENSIVLELFFGDVGFLFTGDVEAEGEASMVAAGLIDDIDILKVSHHGSKYCSTASFLNAAQPEIAIYSAGAGNPYGHPAPETITRLSDVGATIYGTDVHGTIVVTTDGTVYDIEPTNQVVPVTPPQGKHSISGIQIQSVDLQAEVVTILNPGGDSVDVTGWRLGSGEPTIHISRFQARGWR